MVFTVEILTPYLLLTLADLLGIHGAQRSLQGIQLLDAVGHVLFRSPAAAAYRVNHQPRITAHLHRLAAKGNGRGHAGGDAVNINMYVGLALAKGIEDGYTCIV